MLVAMFLAYGGPPFALSGGSRPPHPGIEVDYQLLALRGFHVHSLRFVLLNVTLSVLSIMNE